MALQSSGAISLANIQSEWGGSNPISLSEYYSGSLPSGRSNYGTIPSTGSISFSKFYGTDATWQTTMTVGSFNLLKTQYYGYADPGYTPNGTGSLSDYTIDTFNNYFIARLYWFAGNSGTVSISLGTSGLSNSGWTSLVIKSANGVPLLTVNRASANGFDNTPANATIWSWYNVTNPFGTTVGSTRYIQFVI